MIDAQFHAKVDQLFLDIERWLEITDPNIDFESQEGILTVSLGDGCIVLSRQAPVREIWLASPVGAYHFRDTPAGWLTLQEQSLLTLLIQIFQQCAGITLEIAQFGSGNRS